MFAMTDQGSNQLFSIRFDGKLSKQELDDFHRLLEAQRTKGSMPNALLDMTDFSGWESLEALLADAKLDKKYHDVFKRIAIIGDQTWLKAMTTFADPFVGAELKFFSPDEVSEAIQWAEAVTG